MYNDNWAKLAKEYVDRHSNESGWVDKMIAYYTAPGCEFRLHEYTEHVLKYLRQEADK